MNAFPVLAEPRKTIDKTDFSSILPATVRESLPAGQSKRLLRKTQSDRGHGEPPSEERGVSWRDTTRRSEESRVVIGPSKLDLHVIWRETDRYIETLQRSAREGKQITEAANYARWLQFSGILELLERNSEGGPLPVRGVELRAKLRDVIFHCGEHSKGGRVSAKYTESDIAEINRKLDVLTGQVAGLSAMGTGRMQADASPERGVAAPGDRDALSC